MNLLERVKKEPVPRTILGGTPENGPATKRETLSMLEEVYQKTRGQLPHFEKGGCMSEFDRRREATLTAALAVVKERGGECLDATYTQSGHKILIRCREGHEWRASPYTLIEGEWCFACARDEAARVTREATYAKFRAYVAGQGGAVLDPAYEHRNHKLRVRCEKGHTWATAPTDALSRHVTCPHCARERSVEKKKGGRESKLKARLEAQETASARAFAEFEALKAKVGAKGGTILDSFTGSIPVRLQVRCDRHDHTSLVRVDRVRRGQWCPHCGREKASEAVRQKTFSRACELAEARGGKVVSPSYAAGNPKLTWRCAKGHEWEASPMAVLGKRATWCPHKDCVNTAPTTMTPTERQARGVAVRLAHELEVAKGIAAKRKGTCLSETYTRSSDGLLFRCSRGHVFTLPFKKLKRQWCATCAATRQSYGESVSRAVLEQLIGVPLPLSRPLWLLSLSTREQLSLDMYNEGLRVAFEYHGKGVHYDFRESGRYSDFKKFKRTQEIDKEKEILCADNGVRLVVIRGFDHYVSTKGVIERLKQLLRDHAIAFDEGKEVVLKHDELFSDNLYDRVEDLVCAKNGVLISPIIPGLLHTIEVQCRTHQRIWTTTASSLLNQGKWCKECGKKKIAGSLRLTKAEIQDRVDAVGRKHRITLISMEGDHPHASYATWHCERHGEFQRNVDSILYPQHGKVLGCPSCDEEDHPTSYRRLGKRKGIAEASEA